MLTKHKKERINSTGGINTPVQTRIRNGGGFFVFWVKLSSCVAANWSDWGFPVAQTIPESSE